jgi:hypothetical protein
MSYTKCISGNLYKTGSCVQGAMPTGVFTSGLTQDNMTPNVSKKDSIPFNDPRLLLTPGTSRVLTSAGTSANTALTVGIRAISVYSRNSDVYIQVGSGSQTATTASMFVGSGERVDIDLTKFNAPNIAIIYGPSAAAAIIQLTELS